MRWFSILITLLTALPSIAHAQDGAVAVLYFANQGNPELEPLKVGLAQMLITDLQQSGDLTLVERTRIQDVLAEQQLVREGLVDSSTAARIGELTGARWLVMGTYFELMGSLRIDARVVSVDTGEIVYTAGESAAPEAFLSLEQALATGLRGALQTAVIPKQAQLDPWGATRGSEAPAVVVASPDPEALDAALRYSEGLMAMDEQDLPRAREAFAAAVEADPALTDAQAQLTALSM